MPRPEQYGVLGLRTQQNPQGEPQGALERADNCVIRRAGMIEPRPGFEVLDIATGLSEIHKIIPYDGDLLIVGTDGGEGQTISTVWGASEDSVVDESAQFLQWTTENTRGVEARGNLYLTTADAVRKLESPNSTVAVRAGAPRVQMGYASTLEDTDTADRNWFVTDKKIALCVVLVRAKDANGLVVRSAPSGRFVKTNDSGGARYLTVGVYLGQDDVRAGDQVEVYRTEQVDADLPAPEPMSLANTTTLIAGHITAGFVAINVYGDDEQVLAGEALYTNATQQGIARANVRPPLVRDLALFNGSLFGAHVTMPARLQVSAVESADPVLPLTPVQVLYTGTGIGKRGVVGVRTEDSDTLTSVDQLQELGLGNDNLVRVGMILILTDGERADWTGTANVVVVESNDTTLVLSEQYTGTTDGAPVQLFFADSICVDGDFHRADLIGLIPYQIANGFSADAQVMAYGVGNIYEAGTDAIVFGKRRTIALEAIAPSLESFEVWATHGGDYDPPLPSITAVPVTPGTGLTVEREVWPHGIVWSKQDEPEHFMLGARWLVGAQRPALRRACAAGDSLWLLKDAPDGIYRLTGFGELSGWRVDQEHADTYLLHPDLAVVAEHSLYAWTNKGMVAVTDASVLPISKLAIENTARAQQRAALPADGSFPFAYAIANLKDNELIFGVPDVGDGAGDMPDIAYVWNALTNAWTTWFDSAGRKSCMAIDPASNGRIVAGRSSAGTIEAERSMVADLVNVDYGDDAAVITNIDETELTADVVSSFPITVGDLIVQGAVLAMVMEDLGGDSFRLSAVEGFDDEQDCSHLRAFISTIKWLPHVGPGGSQVKLYKDCVTHWDDTFGLAAWSLTFAGTQVPANSLARSYTRELQRVSHVRGDTRALMSRAVAYNPQLYTTLTIRQGDARWRVSGQAIGFDVVTARVWR